MNWAMAFCAFNASFVFGQNVVLSPPTVKTPSMTMRVCMTIPAIALCDTTTSQGPSRGQHEPVMQVLEMPSELDLTGHPISYGTLFAGMKIWDIRMILDEPALLRHGMRLDEIIVPELRAGGVSRRSSLRFILDAGGIGYYVGEKCLVVTTKHLARVKWLAQLDKPEPEALSASSVGKRRDAAFAAAFWHVDPDVWIEPLTKALLDSDRQVSFDAAYALGELGPEAAGAIDPLARLLKSKDLTLREAAVSALGKIGPKAVKRLLELIDDPDSALAIAAAKALSVMGSVGNEAIPGLIAAATRHADSEELYRSFGSAIAAIDLGDAIPRLRELLKSDSAAIRSFAAFAIGKIGPAGQTCAPDLLLLLTDQSTRVRIDVAYALARLDLPSDFPTDSLEAAVKDSDQHVSLWAAKALRVIKSKR